MVAVAAVLAEAGAVVAVVEEPNAAVLVVVVAKVSGLFLEPPIATAMMMISTTAVITGANHCL